MMPDSLSGRVMRAGLWVVGDDVGLLAVAFHDVNLSGGRGHAW